VFLRFAFAGGSITKEPQFTKVIRSPSHEGTCMAKETASEECAGMRYFTDPRQAPTGAS
jgi:hypothetical protein